MMYVPFFYEYPLTFTFGVSETTIRDYGFYRLLYLATSHEASC
ncbi:hypothetical protein AHF37_12371 [Paragonimus kellicotti]|nr:hypothetical protein AHF37_12371 [Paragonimus kellicotti]